MKNARFIALTCILFIMTSCNSKTGQFLLNNPICDPPCWRGIKVGMDRDSAVDIISTFKDIVLEQSNNMLNKNFDGHSAIIINFHNQAISRMYFVDKRGLFSFEDAINLYGEPDQLYGYYWNMFPMGSGLYACYTRHGIELKFKFQNSRQSGNDNFELLEDTLVTEITYYPIVVENISNASVCSNPDPGYVGSGWHGYGIYQTCDINVNDGCKK